MKQYITISEFKKLYAKYEGDKLYVKCTKGKWNCLDKKCHDCVLEHLLADAEKLAKERKP